VDEVQDGGGDEERHAGLFVIHPVLVAAHASILAGAGWLEIASGRQAREAVSQWHTRPEAWVGPES
jgi:hypothetical protein